VPDAYITVIGLRSPLNVYEARIRSREAGRDPDWYINTPSASPAQELERVPVVEDHVIETADRSACQIADEGASPRGRARSDLIAATGAHEPKARADPAVHVLQGVLSAVTLQPRLFVRWLAGLTEQREVNAATLRGETPKPGARRRRGR
jgi:hypothetical protein